MERDIIKKFTFLCIDSLMENYIIYYCKWINTRRMLGGKKNSDLKL
jgi:hypothetical protein